MSFDIPEYRLSFTPGQIHYVETTGRYIHVTKADNDLDITLDGAGVDEANVRLTMHGGQAQLTDRFSRITLKSETAQNITFRVAQSGSSFDNRREVTVVGKVARDVAATVVDRPDFTLLADAELRFDGLESRDSITVIHDINSASAFVRVGGNPSNTSGARLYPGDSVTLETSGTVRAHNPAGHGDALINVIELRT